ncbi:TerC family protein [Bremerella cremea]|uniref:TerC family protein n=1 Tax=Bremerella cremea TaxID=1031537 RepID=A0A368KTU4_9BACT|nr:TerC family protein [Bremerella cremea]RCS52998.1 TerC family protein [Bremerella cremea]
MWEAFVAVIALSAMEIVLGIDNIVFIAIVSARLPEAQRPNARRMGLLAALVMRIILLCTISWVMGLKENIFELSWLVGNNELLIEHPDMNGITWKDIILFVGGLFLIWKSVGEIHEKLDDDEHSEEDATKVKATFSGVILQIMALDIIFSLDSVITAVGMVKEQVDVFGAPVSGIWLMVTAVLISVGVMITFANTISDFVERHPTLKMLALSFLILIGVMLVAEGAGAHFDKGYVYFAMAFALGVELLNMRVRSMRLTPIEKKIADSKRKKAQGGASK